MSNLDTLPLFPLGSALMPGMDLPLHIFEQRYRQLLSDRDGFDPIFGVVLIRSGREVVDRPEIREIGTAASLVSAMPYPDGQSSIVIRGDRRFRVLEQDWSRDYLVARVAWLDEPIGDDSATDRYASLATERWGTLIRRLAKLVGGDEEVDDLTEALISRLPIDPTSRTYSILGQLPIPAGVRQQYLELPTTEARLGSLIELLESELRFASAFGSSPSLTYSSNKPINPN